MISTSSRRRVREQDPKLPPLYAHGDTDPRPLKAWLIKRLMPAVGHGLLSGQWGAGKTFVVFDLAAALWTGQPFLGHPVKRQCGVLLIAAEGASEVRLRLDAVVRNKCGNMERAPFRWYETTPLLLQKGAVETLIAMAQQADRSLQQEFGLPLGLIVIDTVAACAGYTAGGRRERSGSRPGRDECAEGAWHRRSAASCSASTISARTWRPAPVAPPARRAPAIWCWPASAINRSAAASRTQGWPCGRTGAASRARNTRSPCASWRRRSPTTTASRSPPWWWIGSRIRQAEIRPSRDRIHGPKAGDKISAPRCCG